MLLFRFSALTFNSHRIHYDYDYCRKVEGYPGLVVHGPLLALLMMELFKKHNTGHKMSSFTYRNISPLFDVSPFIIAGRTPQGNTVKLWAQSNDGTLAANGSATF